MQTRVSQFWMQKVCQTSDRAKSVKCKLSILTQISFIFNCSYIAEGAERGLLWQIQVTHFISSRSISGNFRLHHKVRAGKATYWKLKKFCKYTDPLQLEPLLPVSWSDFLMLVTYKHQEVERPSFFECLLVPIRVYLCIFVWNILLDKVWSEREG